jgi:hypothetical protein
MKISRFKIQNLRFIFCVLVFFAAAASFSSINAQSTNQDFPTPVTGSEINGKIAARDIGDSRLTSYFYAFDGSQGDVFINVEAANFNGDIDVFTAGNLRPLTKITLYAGDSTTETGRVIYLRKPEKLIMRVQGRTPNDNPATYRIKFAGAFVALQKTEAGDEPKLPEVKTNENSEVRVNSVGTIIEVRPKPTPSPRSKEAVVAKVEERRKSENDQSPNDIVKADDENVADKSAEKNKDNAERNSSGKETKTVAARETDAPSAAKPSGKKSPTRRQPRRNARTENARTETAESAPETTERNSPETKAAKTSAERNASRKPAVKTEKPKETAPAPNPLETVHLKVQLKDGTLIERPMSEVSRVNVDNKGVLVIVLKDGKISRHSILDVAKMTIE